MTTGDNLIGKKTIYKSIEMKSKLEARVALFLDYLKIKWEYEPQSFLLSIGIGYIPDFYLPELKTWIEVKGKIKEHNLKVSECFVKDNKQEIILISNDKVMFFSNWFEDCEVYYTEDLQIGKCSNCGKVFFCESIGSYHCRSCNYHNGDHDLVNIMDNKNYCFDFYDVESIKDYLRRCSVKC